MGDPIRVLVVDDHPLMRTGIAAMLTHEEDISVVGEAGNGVQALERYRELRPTVTLMDLRMPELDGIGAIKAIVGEFPDARIIALTTYEGDVDIHRAFVAGACGYLNFGLLGMHERAAAARGSLTMRSRPGQGTTVTLDVPLHLARSNE